MFLISSCMYVHTHLNQATLSLGTVDSEGYTRVNILFPFL